MQTQPSLLGRVLGAIVGAAVLVLAFVFSVVIFVVAAVAALIFLGYLWWRTRALRKAQGASDVVIETTDYHEVREERPAIEGQGRRVDE